MQRLLIAFILIAVLGGAAIVVFDGTDGAGGLSSDLSLEVEAAETGPAAEFGKPRDPDAGINGAGPDAHPDSATERRVEESSTDDDLVVVRVVDKETKKPIHKAEVLYQVKNTYNYDEMSAKQVTEIIALGRDPEQLLRRFGRSTFSDKDGLARLRWEKHPWQLVMALHRDEQDRAFYGQTYLNQAAQTAEKPREIQVERDYTLRIRVVDTNGTPQSDVPLALTGRSYRAKQTKPNDFFMSIGKSKGPAGLLELRHFQNWTRNFMNGQQRLESMRVAPHLPGVPRTGPVVSMPEPPAEIVELKLPVTGSITVHVTAPNGRPVLGSSVRLSVVKPPKRKSKNRPYNGLVGWRPQGNDTTTATTGADGIAKFPRVALAKTWKIRVYAGSGRVDEVVAGPSSPGQDIRVGLTLRADTVMITGTVFDGKKQPFADKSLNITILQAPSSRVGARVKTDSQGRFLFALSKNVAKKPVEALIFKGLEHPYKQTGPMAKLVAPRVLHIGTQSIGDVVLTAPPLVLGVYIEDHTGAPAVANLILQRPVPKVSKTGVRSMTWQYDHSGLKPKLLRPGHYEYRGYPASKRLRLMVYSTTYLPVKPVEFEVGTSNLVVKLVKGATIRAIVNSDFPIPQRSLRLELLADTGARSVKSGRQVSTKSNRTSYSWSQIERGSYHLNVRVWGEPQPILTLHNIIVERGHACNDPRLEAIDVRGRLRLVNLTVTTQSTPKSKPKQASTSSSAVLVLGPDGKPRTEAFRIRKGKAQILASRPVYLLVGVRGYAAKALEAVIVDTSVTLTRGNSISVRLKPRAPLTLPAGTGLWVYLRTDKSGNERYRFPTGSGGSLRSLLRGRTQFSRLLTTDGAVVKLPAAGSYTLTYWLRKGKQRQALTGIASTQIAIKKDGQTVELAIPERSLRAALAKLH